MRLRRDSFKNIYTDLRMVKILRWDGIIITAVIQTSFEGKADFNAGIP